MSYTIIKKLPSAEEVIQSIPLPIEAHQKILEDRQEVNNILEGKDKRNIRMNHHPIPTTLKMLINDWIALREIIEEVSLTRKQRQAGTSDINPLYTLLSDIQVEDAFYGPYHHFVEIFAKAYTLISRLRTSLIIHQDENIKTHIQDKKLDLPENIKTDINVALLDKLQKALDNFLRQSFPTWQEHITQWQQQLIMQLTLNEINLSDIEIEDLTTPETLSELLKSCTNRNIEPEKIKNPYYTFSDFLRLKTILCIHSALSRQHKAHTMTEIQKILKILKKDFKQISKEEDELSKNLQDSVNQLIQF